MAVSRFPLSAAAAASSSAIVPIQNPRISVSLLSCPTLVRLSVVSSSFFCSSLSLRTAIPREGRGCGGGRRASRVTRMSMEAGVGVMGTKLGMMSFFQPDGTVVPVTVVGFRKGNIVTQVKTYATDGYDHMLVTNCIFRAGTAAALVTSDPARLGIAKMELVRTLRSHHGADDAAYNAAVQMEDEDGNVGVALTKDLVRVAGTGLKGHISTLTPRVLPVFELLRYIYNVTRSFMGPSMGRVRSLWKEAGGGGSRRWPERKVATVRRQKAAKARERRQMLVWRREGG